MLGILLTARYLDLAMTSTKQRGHGYIINHGVKSLTTDITDCKLDKR